MYPMGQWKAHPRACCKHGVCAVDTCYNHPLLFLPDAKKGEL